MPPLNDHKLTDSLLRLLESYLDAEKFTASDKLANSCNKVTETSEFKKFVESQVSSFIIKTFVANTMSSGRLKNLDLKEIIDLCKQKHGRTNLARDIILLGIQAFEENPNAVIQTKSAVNLAH